MEDVLHMRRLGQYSNRDILMNLLIPKLVGKELRTPVNMVQRMSEDWLYKIREIRERACQRAGSQLRSLIEHAHHGM